MARKKQDQQQGAESRADRKANQHKATNIKNNRQSPELHKGVNDKYRDPNAYLQPGDSHFVDFHKQLSALGLMLRDVPGDGNCLFRALGDQFEGTGANHMQHRLQVVKFMIQNGQDFAPFVADESTFEEYLENLRRPGTYAGQDVLVAFARMHKLNIVIHQLNSPLWHIEGGSLGCRQLHLSYHNGEHYSSVRSSGDIFNAPANVNIHNLACASSSTTITKPTPVKPPVKLPPTVNKNAQSAFLDSATEEENLDIDSGAEFSSGATNDKPLEPSPESNIDSLVEQVMDATGCDDAMLVMDVLMSRNLNAQYATEYLCNMFIFGDPPTPPAPQSITPTDRRSPTFYRLSGAKPKVPKQPEKPHLSNRQRKDQHRRQRMDKFEEKKKQAKSNKNVDENIVGNAFTCLHL